jgi:MFS family permease
VSSWLADHFGAKRVFVMSAFLSAVSAMVFGFFAQSYVTGLTFYALAAAFQGGLYTPAIILFADRYHSSRRGTAVGYLIASTSVGYAFSLAVTGLCLTVAGYRTAFIVTGLLPVLGVIMSWLALRGTPNIIHPRPRGIRVFQLLRKNHDARRLVTGYTAHSWELLGMWSWTPTFFAASFALAGNGLADTAQFGAYLAASMHLVGSFASASLSDHWGRRRVLILVAACGAMLSFTIGWMIVFPVYIVMVIGFLYYFAAIGDSPVLSTAVSESVDAGYLGSVLAVRALLGFSAGAVAPIVFGAVLDWTNPTGAVVTQWGWAFVTLGLGGAIATWYAFRFRGVGAHTGNPTSNNPGNQ